MLHYTEMDFTDLVQLLQLVLTQEEYPGLFISLSKQRTLSAGRGGMQQKVRVRAWGSWGPLLVEELHGRCEKGLSISSIRLAYSIITKKLEPWSLHHKTNWTHHTVNEFKRLELSKRRSSSLPTSWFLVLWDSRLRPSWATWEPDHSRMGNGCFSLLNWW